MVKAPAAARLFGFRSSSVISGCSTGQEAYSLGMTIEHVIRRHQPWLQWHGIGTDISFEAINHAQRAVFEFDAVRDVPLEYRNWYLDRDVTGGWRVAQSILSQTHFFHSNLLHIASAPFAMFDVVFCQNVLIYFDRATRLAILDELFARTRSQGLLILGAGEDIGWSADGAERIAQRGVTAFKKLEV